ncbi:hypothetical protein [Streptomyces sp. A0592]|uniref:hypothetical protein n=1 Tax=Streptomyces sp. A0592 TaxID=2563099 RepID=UPI00109EE18A|nr:hypothetical protein [Streptomyces sp. A0592]THA86828.1 hypothetical protein E6U81_01720 [Streptomyces sp. A0592]
MTDFVKHLPRASIPEGAVRFWDVDDARRWIGARAPAAFAPARGARLLGTLVILSLVLTSWSGAPATGLAAGRPGYALVVLLAALPVWFRYLPAAVLAAAPVLAADAALAATRASGAAGRTGRALVVACCAWAFTGALLRLRARRRQRGLSLAAAGPDRFALPSPLPAAHRRRGLTGMVLGSLCCAAAAGALVGAPAHPDPYELSGRQVCAGALLVAGSALLGRGCGSRLAARRLHARPQPALLVGVRRAASGHLWLVPDAVTRTAPPLIAYSSASENSLTGQRVLLARSARALRTLHHDVDPGSEPIEAVLHGPVYEGAEVVVECAVYEGDIRLVPYVTAAPLLPRRVHGLGGWQPSGSSFRERVREAERLAREERAERERRRKESRSSDTAAGGCGGGGCDSGCGGGGCGGCG